MLRPLLGLHPNDSIDNALRWKRNVRDNLSCFVVVSWCLLFGSLYEFFHVGKQTVYICDSIFEWTLQWYSWVEVSVFNNVVVFQLKWYVLEYSNVFEVHMPSFVAPEYHYYWPKLKMVNTFLRSELPSQGHLFPHSHYIVTSYGSTDARNDLLWCTHDSSRKNISHARNNAINSDESSFGWISTFKLTISISGQ